MLLFCFRSLLFLTNRHGVLFDRGESKNISAKTNDLQLGLNQGAVVSYSDAFLTELILALFVKLRHLRSLCSHTLLILANSSQSKGQIVHQKVELNILIGSVRKVSEMQEILCSILKITYFY